MKFKSRSFALLLAVFVTSSIVTSKSFGQSAASPAKTTTAWRPILDSSKCVAAVLWSVPTIIGLGVGQFGAAISDIGALILDGELCISSTKLVSKSYAPVLQTLFQMGCVAPMDDIRNPVYYTEIEKNGDIRIEGEGTGYRFFHCAK